jgi:hypothetical protein
MEPKCSFSQISCAGGRQKYSIPYEVTEYILNLLNPYGPEVYSASNRDEYKESSWR